MICETFDIKNENSQEYARLNTYLISHSDSIKTETRPLIILKLRAIPLTNYVRWSLQS